MEKGFFQTKIGHQTIAGLVTVLAFPLLYAGGLNNNSFLTLFGMMLVILGMTAAPVITYMHGWNSEEMPSVDEKEDK